MQSRRRRSDVALCGSMLIIRSDIAGLACIVMLAVRLWRSKMICGQPGRHHAHYGYSESLRLLLVL